MKDMFLLNRHEEALEAANRTQALDPSRKHAFIYKGMIFMDNGMY
jgi:hypothetical protein